MSYQSSADEQAFASIFARDPASRCCFECGYENATWCIITHGLFVCLDCSGRFRGLGVHLCFVRSATMDGWSDWKPEKLKQMMIGGNGRARKFFDSHGLSKAATQGQSLNARFSSKAALMYRDLLEAEATGQPFSEATWQPPEWWSQQQQSVASAAANLGAGSGDPNRRLPAGLGRTQMQSAGSQQQQGGGGGSKSGGVDDFLGYLGSAASTVVDYSSKAAQVAVQKSKELADTVEKSAKEADIAMTASKTVDSVGEVASSAWGWASSWTSAGVTALSSIAKSAAEQVQKGLEGGDTAGADDGGLSALTRNVKPSDRDYGHTEHRAPAARPVPEAGRDLGALASSQLRPTGKYEGIGSSPVSNYNNNAETARFPKQATPTTTAPVSANSGSNDSNMDAIFGGASLSSLSPSSASSAAAIPKGHVVTAAVPVKRGFKPVSSSPVGAATATSPACVGSPDQKEGGGGGSVEGGDGEAKKAGGWDDDW